jgi:uncharacterized membrane protein
LKPLRFPEPFKHKHVQVRNVNEVFEEQLTFGQRVADWVAKTAGSWQFIIVQSPVLIGWAVLNVTAWVRHWDPYPLS